jgi:integrase
MSAPDAQTAIHPANASLRIAFLKDCAATGMPPRKVDQRRATTAQLILLAGERPLSSFDIGELNALITRATHMRTGETLSAERLRKIFDHARELLDYVCDEQPDVFKRVRRRHLKNLSASVVGIKTATDTRRPFYDLAELQTLAAARFDDELVLQRAQAAACLQFLSGMRVGALASLPLAAIDLPNRRVHQWTTLGVRTKGRKTATTTLLDLPELLAPVRAWHNRLTSRLSNQAMFFNVFADATTRELTERAAGVNRGQAVSDDYRLLCERAGVPFKGTHALRHGHIVYCARRCRTPTDFMALSQNVMHADERMTRLYAMLESHEVAGAYASFGAGAPGEIGDAVSQIQTLLASGEIPNSQRKALKMLAGNIIEVL